MHRVEESPSTWSKRSSSIQYPIQSPHPTSFPVEFHSGFKPTRRGDNAANVKRYNNNNNNYQYAKTKSLATTTTMTFTPPTTPPFYNNKNKSKIL